ncbi:MAG TPA: FAD-dependent oxidoreductase [Prosthecobacter sp.]
MRNSPFLTESGKAELLALRACLANGYPTRDWDHRTVREWLDTEIAQPEVRALMEGQLRLSTYCNEPSLQSAGAALDQLLVGAADGVDYLDGGWQSLVAALEKAATAAGAVILTRHAVSEIHAQTGQVSLRFADGSTSTAKVVISTLPPEVIARSAGTGQAPALQRWAESLTPVYAACLDIALQHLPQPDHQFAIGLDEPLYYSVHTRSARLAPEGGALIQLAKYLDCTSATEGKPEDIRAELEALMDRFQPGWREMLVHQRFLPRMLVTHAVVTPAGRPPVHAAGLPSLLLAGDWVGPHGMLVDASLSSARDAAQSALDWLRRQDQDLPARATLLTS